MHKSGIIISVNPKIMVNSQYVYFGITRQCAQVGVRNINIFNMKNFFMQICQRWKNIFRKRFT
jgi:hypothetical protein